MCEAVRCAATSPNLGEEFKGNYVSGMAKRLVERLNLTEAVLKNMDLVYQTVERQALAIYERLLHGLIICAPVGQ